MLSLLPGKIMTTEELHFKAPVNKTELQWNFSTTTFPISEMKYQADLFLDLIRRDLISEIL